MLSDAIKKLESMMYGDTRGFDLKVMCLLREILLALGEPEKRVTPDEHDKWIKQMLQDKRFNAIESRLSALEAQCKECNEPVAPSEYRSPAIPVDSLSPAKTARIEVLSGDFKEDVLRCFCPYCDRNIILSPAIPAKPRAQGVEEKIISLISDSGFEPDEKVERIISLVRYTRPDVVEVPRDVAEKYIEWTDGEYWAFREPVERLRDAIRKSLSK